MTADFTAPDGTQWGTFSNLKGAEIRYAFMKAACPRGTVVILPGFRESIEKYFDVAALMQARGLNVYMMDWRGQGGSARYIKGSEKAHHEGYDEQIATLHQFTQDIVEKSDAAHPMVMMAQSMGGHIGLRYLNEHAGVFDAAIVTAPMVDIVTGAIPVVLSRKIAQLAVMGGYADKYVPNGGDWHAAKTPFDGNDKTSDAARYKTAMDFYTNHPSLRMGDATYGWLYHTFASIDVLNGEDYLKNIKTPVLMQTAGDERIVSRSAQDRAAALIPDCEHVHIAEARHEIWRERDGLRNAWIAAMDKFIDKHVPPQKDNKIQPPTP